MPESMYERTFGFLVGSAISFLLVLAVVVIVVSWLISTITTILKYGNFKIEKYGNELVVSRGLLEQRQLTLNTKRITAIRLVRNIFRQPFGYVSVYVESAGGGTSDEQLSTILIPIIPEKQLQDVLLQILPEYGFELDFNSAPKRALRHFFCSSSFHSDSRCSRSMLFFFRHTAISDSSLSRSLCL